MNSIHITTEHGRVCVIIDGAKLTKLHSLSVDYVKGAPILLSMVADVGDDKRTEHWVLH